MLFWEKDRSEKFIHVPSSFALVSYMYMAQNIESQEYLLNIINAKDGDHINNLRFPTTTYTGNVVLTCRPSGEKSVHNCPWHLDHSELLTPDISLHPDDHSCSKPENDLMESWTSRHGYVKIHFILVLKCVSSYQLYTVHSYSESKVLISFEPAHFNFVLFGH